MWVLEGKCGGDSQKGNVGLWSKRKCGFTKGNVGFVKRKCGFTKGKCGFRKGNVVLHYRRILLKGTGGRVSLGRRR